MHETVIDFIRHGSPEGGRLYRGHTIDDPLSDKGWQQLWSTVADHSPWQQIVTSPMQRCRAFAEALGERHGISVQVDNDFREVGFGSWEGRSPQEIEQNEPDAYRNFYLDPVNNRPRGAEPLQAFGDRVSAAYRRLITNYPGQHLLVVGHAGVIRAALGHVMQAPPAAWYRCQVNTAAVTRFSHSALGNKLLFHNLNGLPD